MTQPSAMSSNRPYLLRAMYEWISDNGLTPYILVDAASPACACRPARSRTARSCSTSPRARSRSSRLDNERIRFLARFSGVSQGVEVPMTGVLAIYAQENGQGMMFPAENAPPEPPPATAKTDEAVAKKPHLRVVK